MKRRSQWMPTCLHSSSEGKVLEDPAVEAPDYVYMRTIDPQTAPDIATDITIGFEKGDAVSINGKRMSAAELFTQLNKLGHDNGIGRLDLVENRYVGNEVAGCLRNTGWALFC